MGACLATKEERETFADNPSDADPRCRLAGKLW